jgi:RimJ/RimL family protein N-acetyltransferase
VNPGPRVRHPGARGLGFPHPVGPETARLVAEPPDADRHLEFALHQLSDPRIWPWHWPERPDGSGGPRTREQIREAMQRQARQLADKGYALWWWRERSSGELIGYVGLSDDLVEGEPAVEVGWSIHPDRQREGFATEAARASVEWGFEVCGLEEIVSFTMRSNVASRRVMERIGMEHARGMDRAGLPHVLYTIRPS